MTRVLVQQDQFERRARELALQGKLGNASKAPIDADPRTGAWSGHNQLGFKTRLTPDQNGAQIQTRQAILKLDEWGFPEVWTVSLSIQQIGNSDVAQGQLIQADIDFGTGGSTETVRVDWLNGTMLSLPMNAVDVHAVFNNGFFGPNEYEVAVQVARGNINNGASPVVTITENPVAIANGQTVEFTIPKFVKRVKFANALGTVASVADFYSDLNAIRLREVTAGTIRQTIRAGDLLRGIPGIDVVGPGHIVDYSNASGNPVLIVVYGELFF